MAVVATLSEAAINIHFSWDFLEDLSKAIRRFGIRMLGLRSALFATYIMGFSPNFKESDYFN